MTNFQKKDFETQNFEILDKVANKSDKIII